MNKLLIAAIVSTMATTAVNAETKKYICTNDNAGSAITSCNGLYCSTDNVQLGSNKAVVITDPSGIKIRTAKGTYYGTGFTTNSKNKLGGAVTATFDPDFETLYVVSKALFIPLKITYTCERKAND